MIVLLVLAVNTERSKQMQAGAGLIRVACARTCKYQAAKSCVCLHVSDPETAAGALAMCG